METPEQNNTNKVPIGAKIDPALYAVIEQLACEDERSLSNMIERLLKQSPPVQRILESAETAAAV